MTRNGGSSNVQHRDISVKMDKLEI
jgi:hypothetical protein